MKWIVALWCSWPLALLAQHQEYYPDSSSIVRAKLEEWRDLKFGLLMHWGPYSQWGIVESWSICPEDLSWAAHGRKPGFTGSYNDYVNAYEHLGDTFNPHLFDPEKWAQAAANAGMRYLVFTTKHHDGFCMFDSHLTEYKITSPQCAFHAHPKSNVAKEIFSAFRKSDFWIGAYYSKPDWHCDDYWWDYFPASDRNCNYAIEKYPEKWNRFVNYTHGQIHELMSEYGDIDILWLDGGWVRAKDSLDIAQTLHERYENSRWARNPQSQDIRMSEIVSKARAIRPDLIVVDRAVPGPYQNYLTPEQHIPETGLPYPWETCMTMANSWSYTPNDTYKTSDVLITNLVDVVSKGGNFLLNIGPAPDGTLAPEAYARLRDIGRWMDANSDAIYSTRMYEVYKEPSGMRYTQKEEDLYLHFEDMPTGECILQHVTFDKKWKASVLANGQKIVTYNADGKLGLRFEKAIAGEYIWVIRLSH